MSVSTSRNLVDLLVRVEDGIILRRVRYVRTVGIVDNVLAAPHACNRFGSVEEAEKK